MVEQGTHNPLVAGSSPAGPTRGIDMTRFRELRRCRMRTARFSGIPLTALIVAALIVIATGFFGVRAWLAADDVRESVTAPASADLTPSVGPTASAGAENAVNFAVEVPFVTGRTVQEAKALLKAAGLAVEQVPATGSVSPGTVVDQNPPAGSMLPAGETVVLGVAGYREARHVFSGFVVTIDPGHQSRSDQSPEPIGPGATVTKPRVLGGTTGVSTRIPEYEIALQISMNLKQRLEAAGVKVVMTRQTNDVNVSNAERARIANAAGADLFVRIHADGSPDTSISGISTLYPESNQWTAAIAQPSKRAAELIHAAVISATGAVCRGTIARGDLSGFNHSQVPVVLVESGFMSNPVEDRLLASPHYQDKLAQGITEGIFAYFKGISR